MKINKQLEDCLEKVDIKIKQEVFNNMDKIEQSREDVYVFGQEQMLKKALEVLDAMFMEQCSISVNDWFRDSPNLFRGRKEFIKRVKE